MARRDMIKLIIGTLVLILGVVFFLLRAQESKESSGVGDVGLLPPVELPQECLAMNSLRFGLIVLGAQESHV